jgi:hypothetical protein
MLLESEKEELYKFFQEYPDAYYRCASTMYVGYVSCIKPIPTICGAEYMCHPDTYESVVNFKRGVTNE